MSEAEEAASGMGGGAQSAAGKTASQIAYKRAAEEMIRAKAAAEERAAMLDRTEAALLPAILHEEAEHRTELLATQRVVTADRAKIDDHELRVVIDLLERERAAGVLGADLQRIELEIVVMKLAGGRRVSSRMSGAEEWAVGDDVRVRVCRPVATVVPAPAEPGVGASAEDAA